MATCSCCGQTILSSSFLANLETNTISYKESTVRTSPQVVEILFLLHKHYPRPVRHAELNTGLWGYNGSDEYSRRIIVLVFNARAVGKVLGFEIETIYGRGYRLILNGTPRPPAMLAHHAMH